MTTYYLQQHDKGGRWIIDSTFPLNAYKVAESRDASEWLEAKRLFGFRLTVTQRMLLDKHRRSANESALT